LRNKARSLPPGCSLRKALSLDMALDIARGALDKCRADGYRTTVAILDTGGNLKISLRDDGTSPHTVEVAHKKAYTALIYRRPSMETAKAWATQVPPALHRRDDRAGRRSPDSRRRSGRRLDRRERRAGAGQGRSLRQRRHCRRSRAI
jgi:hypothetical protein